MGKKLILLLMMLVAVNVYADSSHHGTTVVNNYYSSVKNYVDAEQDVATNNAFAALNFDKGTTGLQWACGLGYNRGAVGKACGIGFRMDGDPSILVNGAIGDDDTANIGIGGTF